MGASSSQNARWKMTYGPGRVCCNRCRRPVPPTESLGEEMIDVETSSALKVDSEADREAIPAVSSCPSEEAASEKLPSEKLPSQPSVPVTEPDEDFRSIQSESSLSAISWNKTLAQILGYPPMSADDSVTCCELWLKARKHRTLEELFVDAFIDHFLDEDADKSADKARRLFPIFEVTFRALKLHGERSLNANAEERSGYAIMGKHSDKTTLSKVVVRIKSKQSIRTLTSKSSRKKARGKKDLDDRLIDVPVGATIGSITKWERLMRRIGKALKHRSISVVFYRDVFEVLYHAIAEVELEAATRAKLPWRRMEGSSLRIIEKGSEDAAVVKYGRNGPRGVPTTEQIDRILVGLPRTPSGDNANANCLKRPSGIRRKQDTTNNSSNGGRRTRNRSNSNFNGPAGDCAPIDEKRNVNYRGGRRVIFGERGFIYP